MTLTTTTQIAGPVNVVFQRNLLSVARTRCPYFVGGMPAEIMSHSGTFTAKWRRYNKLTAVTTALSELTGVVGFPTRQADQPTVTDITATLSKYGNFLYLTEEVDLINFDGQMAELSDRLGENAGQSLNRLQRNILEDNLTAVLVNSAGGFATTATNVAGTITLAQIRSVHNTLNRNSGQKFTQMTQGSRNINTSPIRSSFLGINHVDVSEDIRQLTGFLAVEQYSNQTEIFPFEYGYVGGVRWVETEEASIDVDSGATATAGIAVSAGVRSTSGSVADIYNCVILAREAHGHVGLDTQHIQTSYREGDRLPAVITIAHPRGSAGAADALNELSSIGWKSWHTGVILNGTWGRTIRCAASFLG